MLNIRYHSNYHGADTEYCYTLQDPNFVSSLEYNYRSHANTRLGKFSGNVINKQVRSYYAVHPNPTCNVRIIMKTVRSLYRTIKRARAEKSHG